MAVGTAALIIGGLSAAMQGAGAIKGAAASKEQAEFQASQDRFNAGIAEMQADDAIARGEVDSQNLMNQTRGLKGSQRAASAGSGVDVNSGSAADLVADTDRASALDVITIKSNAAKEAFNYKVQAKNLTTQAGMTQRAGQNASSNTLLTGGASVLSTAGNAFGSWEKTKAESLKAGK